MKILRLSLSLKNIIYYVIFILILSTCKAAPEISETPPATAELIIPEHTITGINTTVNLQCDPQITESNSADRYEWQLIKPEGSEASLTADQSNASVTLDDTEGYYIIKLTIYKNDACTGINYAYIGTPSVVHYIRAGATGADTGTDWTNAWKELPADLVRGHTYYIADGTYPAYNCTTTTEDIIPVYIKKATAPDHGTGTGWNNDTMGAGQAVFTDTDNYPPFSVNASYIVIDGQAGKEKGDAEQYGFVFSNSSTVNKYGFLAGNRNGVAAAISNIKLKHSEIINTSEGGRGFQVHGTVTSCTNLLIHSCYIHDTKSVPVYFASTAYSIVEYCYIARNHSDSVDHGEGLQTSPDGCTHCIIRYNIWEDIEGTAVIVGSSHWEVYGNIFFWTSGYYNSDPANRHVEGRTCSNGPAMGIFDGARNHSPYATRCKIYNNTIVAGYPSSGDYFANNLGVYCPAADNETFNNIWINCDKLPRLSGTHDYNMFYNNNLINNGPYFITTETNIQNASSDPFVNSANYDFRLNSETQPGKILDGIYSYDMLGNKRGASGTWSRGALQYQ